MNITATVTNSYQQHHANVSTESNEKSLTIPYKGDGFGSQINGGELLFLALATCYCNDVYREAAKRNLVIEKVEVTVNGQFGNEGEPARNITYQVKISSPTSEAIPDLLRYVDKVAEVHNTLRKGTSVTLLS